MNLPNRLTVSRFVLTAAFLAALFTQFRFNTTVALVLFVAAGITDWMDGAIARRRNLITNFGTLLDPLADKILTCCAFIALIGRGGILAWMAALIVSRELAITGLRLMAASKNVVLAAEGWGKHKTIWQMITIIAVLVQVSYGDWGVIGRAIFGWELFGRAWVAQFATFSLWLTMALTFFSGLYYLWRNRQLYLSDM
jgi:CDP-diacylglycerol--glycerol-3-phosphate 3-phosphatidyltransferase